MMTPAQLADLLLNPLAQSHMELLVENIRIAMAYHKNQVSFYLWYSGYYRVTHRAGRSVRLTMLKLIWGVAPSTLLGQCSVCT